MIHLNYTYRLQNNQVIRVRKVAGEIFNVFSLVWMNNPSATNAFYSPTKR